MSEPGYRIDGEMVVVSMTVTDWNALMMSLGYALGAHADRHARTQILGLVNRMNAGNPNFTPYEVPA